MTKAERFAKRLDQMRKDGVSQSTLDTLKTEWETAQALPMEGTGSLTAHVTADNLFMVPEDVRAALARPEMEPLVWKITKKNDGGRRLEITVPPETPTKTPEQKK